MLRKLACTTALIACTLFPVRSDAELSGQLMVAPGTPSWLVYNRDSDSDGRPDPAFICGPGDPEDFLYRGSRRSDGTRSGDQQAIIDNIVAHGANSIYIQAIRSHGGDGSSSHNPFINSDPANQLDEDILSQWDGWLAQLDQAGVVIYFFFYDDSARIWSGDTVNAAEEAMISQLVQRYMHLRHLVWVVAEEYSERYSPTRVSNIAALIKTVDTNNHVVANHQLSSLSFDHAGDPNIDQFALQYNTTTVEGMHSGMVSAWRNSGGRYSVMMAEAVDHGYDDRATCRQKNWASAMAGAYVMVLRMDGTAAYNDKMDDCRRMVAFFEGIDLTAMSPHDELGNSGTWVLAQPGSSYIAYRRTAGTFTLSGMQPGDYLLKWFDPASGDTVNRKLRLTQTTNTFSRPATIAAEAALQLTRAGTPGNTPHAPVIPAAMLLLGEEH